MKVQWVVVHTEQQLDAGQMFTSSGNKPPFKMEFADVKQEWTQFLKPYGTRCT